MLLENQNESTADIHLHISSASSGSFGKCPIVSSTLSSHQLYLTSDLWKPSALSWSPNSECCFYSVNGTIVRTLPQSLAPSISLSMQLFLLHGPSAGVPRPKPTFWCFSRILVNLRRVAWLPYSSPLKRKPGPLILRSSAHNSHCLKKWLHVRKVYD